jgi:hypothetical protein
VSLVYVGSLGPIVHADINLIFKEFNAIAQTETVMMGWRGQQHNAG